MCLQPHVTVWLHSVCIVGQFIVLTRTTIYDMTVMWLYNKHSLSTCIISQDDDPGAPCGMLLEKRSMAIFETNTYFFSLKKSSEGPYKSVPSVRAILESKIEHCSSNAPGLMAISAIYFPGHLWSYHPIRLIWKLIHKTNHVEMTDGQTDGPQCFVFAFQSKDCWIASSACHYI